MGIVVHTMEYHGGAVNSPLHLRNYRDEDYPTYRTIHEDCFFPMRSALGLWPYRCCASREELAEHSRDIHIYERDGELIGSVMTSDHEIDHLIVAKDHQKRGYGGQLLNYAVQIMQEQMIAPITLYVLDWNQGALGLYLKHGFQITETKTEDWAEAQPPE